jgi:hypothetical protein
VHLSLRDQREGVRAEFDGVAVDQVLPAAGANPDQLVIGVPVRLADLAVGDPPELERAHLERVRLGGQIIDRGLSHDPYSRESAHEPRLVPA